MKVIRDGEQILVENTEVVVGDLLLLDTGDKIVADGIVVKGFNLVVDEAPLTGETEPVQKGEDDIWCMSGSEVSFGQTATYPTVVLHAVLNVTSILCMLVWAYCHNHCWSLACCFEGDFSTAHDSQDRLPQPLLLSCLFIVIVYMFCQ